jgi:hypothetical protein
MKTIMMTGMGLAALAIATVATVSSSTVSGALARAEGFSQPTMPLGEITANAESSPAKGVNAF